MPHSRAVGFKKIFFLLFFALILLLSAASSWATTNVINYSYDKTYQILNASYDSGSNVNYVYDNSGNRLILSSSSSAPANNPPNAPVLIAPALGAKNVVYAPILSWQDSDPDPGDTLVYYLYFGTSPTQLSLIWSGAATSYQLTDYNPFVTNYWQVVAKDSHNAVTNGSIWYFGTVSPTSTITYPVNGQSLTGASRTISGSAADSFDNGVSGPGINRVEISINGGAWISANDASGDGSWSSWSYAWAPPAAGFYTIQSRATDNAGSVETPGVGVIVTVNNGNMLTSVWGWGYGQFGDGTTTSSTIPVQVNGLSGLVAIACGGSQTIALKSDGTVWAWGDNSQGELGNGPADNNQHPTPVQVNGLSGITAITCGAMHTIALKSDGTVWTWGDNEYGQIGNGTVDTTGNNPQTTPVLVSGLSGVTAIACGWYHTLALKSDGTVWAWGDNSQGELGDGDNSYSNSSVPVQVSGLSVDRRAILTHHRHPV